MTVKLITSVITTILKVDIVGVVNRDVETKHISVPRITCGKHKNCMYI